MIIEIDDSSGFCFGVVFAIEKAEEELEANNRLYCLGDIVHNNEEVERLREKGLITINHSQFKKLKNCKVLIRAHGEPPETYRIAKENNIQLIDATCPVVLKLQKRIRKGYQAVSDNGQILIYGKEGHAEVNGLVGQTDGNAIVIENKRDLGKLDFSKPVHLFSQTTKSIDGFQEISSEIRKRLPVTLDFIANDTICRQVSRRGPMLKKFSRKHNVIIFVSGKKSSNGKMLYHVCLEENKNTFFVSDEHEIKAEWFRNARSTGICGATSTPRWLMEKISDKIRIMISKNT